MLLLIEALESDTDDDDDEADQDQYEEINTLDHPGINLNTS